MQKISNVFFSPYSQSMANNFAYMYKQLEHSSKYLVINNMLTVNYDNILIVLVSYPFHDLHWLLNAKQMLVLIELPFVQ